MSDVTIHFRDGTKKELKEGSRSGGSWTQSVRYEGSAVVIIDVWGNTTAFPLDLVARIETRETRSGW
jgi:hypothetical protein